MRAAVGDRIVIRSNALDRPVRSGRVIEVRHADGTPPYLVEWSDTGRSALVFPGPDARVETARQETGVRDQPDTEPAPVSRHVRTWYVRVQLFETDRATVAHAVLHSGEAGELRADGHVQRLEGELDLPEIGAEIAAGRALHALGEVLLSAASGDLASVHAHPATAHGAHPATAHD